MKRRISTLVALILALAGNGWGYPLDGTARSGVRRLEGYRNAHTGGGSKLPPGALWPTDAIRLHLASSNPAWDPDETPKDPVLQAALDSIFAKRDPSYAVAVIDFSDPERPVWAGRREDVTQMPGSVGKVLCMAALFDGLRRAFPETAARERVLRETVVEATDWVVADEHAVPRLDPETGRNRFSVIQPGETFTLSEWVDHMISASANAAGAVVWKEAMLLRVFGKEYPPSAEQEAGFFKETSKSRLTELSQEVINEPLAAAGIKLDALQQGSFWTRTGKAKVPGIRSFASPRELVRFLLRIEQGRLVDAWSSLEMKRYLYMTKRRYRYVYAPELSDAAVFFKSGSLYRCRAEEGYKCGKYMGNQDNFMNSIAIVEVPAKDDGPARRYIVALLSNVLRVNSAWDHSRVGAAIDAAVETRRPVEVQESGNAEQKAAAGRGD